MSALNNLLVLSTISCILVFVNTQSVHRRFEYKYSFKPPYLAQKDGSVPFWEYGGNAIASGESVRLAPSMRSQKGAIWSKHPLSFDWWEVDVMFKVTGRGRIGADGLYGHQGTYGPDFDIPSFWAREGGILVCKWGRGEQLPNTRLSLTYWGPWTYKGESVRLAPSMRSQKGAIWSKHPLSFDWWEVDVMFKVTGRGRIGADGLAFWYTTQRGDYTGEVFGSSDRWNGLALIFDSFDNDNKHNNPYIMAVLNDGTKVFDHKSDGSTQLLSGCLRDFRNKPFPTRARIEYYLNTLTVYFHNGMTNNEADYELCFRAENVVLPRGGYFGLSAATGGLADDHDVIHLLTTSLHTTQQQGGQQISADEQQKLDREYQEYQQKLEQQKDQYRKDHPDEMKDKESEFDDWFESDGQREFRQIWQGVMALQDALRDVNKKVDEVIGKQTNSLSLLSAVYSHTQGQPIQPAAPGQPPAQMPSLPIGRHDWDGLVANNQIMINTIAELKGFIIEVARKSDALIAASGGAPAAAGAINPQFLSEMRDSMHQLKQSVAGVAQRMSNAPQVVQQPMSSCPDVSCVSLTGLLVVVAAQLTLMFFYAVYKERKEAQAKKFF